MIHADVADMIKKTPGGTVNLVTMPLPDDALAQAANRLQLARASASNATNAPDPAGVRQFTVINGSDGLGFNLALKVT